MAKTMIRLNALDPVDSISWSPHVGFKLYIDNSSISAIGTFNEVVSGITAGARALEAAADDIGATLSADKATLICSNRAAGLQIQESPGLELSRPLVTSGVT